MHHCQIQVGIHDGRNLTGDRDMVVAGMAVAAAVACCALRAGLHCNMSVAVAAAAYVRDIMTHRFLLYTAVVYIYVCVTFTLARCR